MALNIHRSVKDLKKGDRVIGDLYKPGPSSMTVVEVKLTDKTAKVVLDTHTGLGYDEYTLRPDDQVNVAIDKYKFIEK